MNKEIKIPEWVTGGIIGLVVVIIVIVLLNPFVIVGPGERGVVLRFGAVQNEIKQEGLNFKIPLIEQVKIIDVKIRKRECKAAAASKDLQTVHTEITLNYYVNPDKVHLLWQRVGPDFEYKLVDPAVHEALKAVTARFTAEELIKKRPEVRSQIEDMLRKRLERRYLKVDAVSITDFNFSAEFNAAIEAKQKAEQLALKAERDLARVRMEAEQRITQARAEAEALRLKREQVTPELIRLREIEARLEAINKWNGVLPQYVGGGPVPFIEVTPPK